jgi:hypothetical protein
MSKTCPKSCNACGKAKEEKQSSEPKKQKLSLPEAIKDQGLQVIEESDNYGEKQRVEGAESVRVVELLAASIEYMKSDQVKALPAKIRDNCRNKHELCSFWSMLGKRIRLFLLIEYGR